jgi:outer membrane receptor for monomeric catechols
MGMTGLGTAQTGDSYAIVNNASYGNAKLARESTPGALEAAAVGAYAQSQLLSSETYGLDAIHTEVAKDSTVAKDATVAKEATLTGANTELSSIPNTTASLKSMIQFLFTYFRNKKTVTTTTETLMKEDAATVLGTATISDDGATFTKGEMG